MDADGDSTAAVATPTPETETKKRKPTETRSVVWQHFEKIYGPDDNLIQGKCMYCSKVYAAESKKHGTSSMKNHTKTCIHNPHAKETRQSKLAFASNSESETVLTNWVFNKDNVRKAMARI
ncbi:hypothetical protein OSB04_029293 [Centaurea solstitialis]|uniref:BED-type domain-containing protein n=1 Tax=Centaurea solstitialis TaxID=347529 RepID=A0AA38T0X5_9ASTR|nr:hypothetical protein OSB04_029293 [Centaurea solstitialis]